LDLTEGQTTEPLRVRGGNALLMVEDAAGVVLHGLPTAEHPTRAAGEYLLEAGQLIHLSRGISFAVHGDVNAILELHGQSWLELATDRLLPNKISYVPPEPPAPPEPLPIPHPAFGAAHCMQMWRRIQAAEEGREKFSNPTTSPLTEMSRLGGRRGDLQAKRVSPSRSFQNPLFPRMGSSTFETVSRIRPLESSLSVDLHNRAWTVEGWQVDGMSLFSVYLHQGRQGHNPIFPLKRAMDHTGLKGTGYEIVSMWGGIEFLSPDTTGVVATLGPGEGVWATHPPVLRHLPVGNAKYTEALVAVSHG